MHIDSIHNLNKENRNKVLKMSDQAEKKWKALCEFTLKHLPYGYSLAAITTKHPSIIARLHFNLNEIVRQKSTDPCNQKLKDYSFILDFWPISMQIISIRNENIHSTGSIGFFVDKHQPSDKIFSISNSDPKKIVLNFATFCLFSDIR